MQCRSCRTDSIDGDQVRNGGWQWPVLDKYDLRRRILWGRDLRPFFVVIRFRNNNVFIVQAFFSQKWKKFNCMHYKWHKSIVIYRSKKVGFLLVVEKIMMKKKNIMLIIIKYCTCLHPFAVKCSCLLQPQIQVYTCTYIYYWVKN